jgi:flagellar hook-associated protein 3 FlgL
LDISMRITDSQRFATALTRVTTGNAAVSQAADRLSSGRRYTRLSEDPVAGSRTLALDSDLRALAQYRRTIATGQARTRAEEAALQQVTDLLTRAKELATAQGSSTGNAATRLATAAEVRALRAQVLAQGNAQVDGGYLFGGRATGAPPFLPDGSYLGTTDGRTMTIAPGQSVSSAVPGQALLVDSGVLAAFDALETALTANDPAGVRTAGAAVDGALDATQTLLAETGARDRALEVALEANIARQDALAGERAGLNDIPLEEASLALAQAQTSLQAAYLATSRILSLNLAEYLR